MRFRPLHHTFAPMADRAQCIAALGMLCTPWRWRNGRAVRRLEEVLGQRYAGTAVAFSSGRESLLAYLRALQLAKGDEIIVQGYTCIVVPNAIQAAGCTPVFVDIDPETLNLEPAAVEAAITPRTRAVICQHTFGIPAESAKLRGICDRHGILLIEDCAHILPDTTGPQEICRHGDAFLLSFGRDKAVSGVSGGAIISRTPQADAAIIRLRDNAEALPLSTIARLLLYPPVYAMMKPLYGWGIGKGLLWCIGKLRVLVPIVTQQEKKGSMSGTLHSMPDPCATLALRQFRHLQQINDHRRDCTTRYRIEAQAHGWPVLQGIRDDLPLQKFPLFVPRAEDIRRRMKQRNIHLHDGWTGCVVCPQDTDETCAGYHDGDNPSAEMAGTQILSLPTHPGTTGEDIDMLLTALLPHLSP